MFTPPPSPFPPVQPSLPGPTPAADEKSSASSQSLEPSTPSTIAVTSTYPRPHVHAHSNSKRRIFIPLVAAILVVIAITSRLTSFEGQSLIYFPSPSNPPPSAGNDSSSTRRQRRNSLLNHISRQLKSSHNRRQNNAAAPNDGLSPTATTLSPSSPSPDPVLPDLAANNPVSSDAAQVAPPIPNPPYPVPTPFPQPFDSSFSFNFSTQSCQTFFATGFLSNSTFRSCRAFSLLLPSSQAFFEAQDNYTTLTAVMGGTCATPATQDQCVDTMNWLATELQKESVCGKDLKDQNSNVLGAWRGFKNYNLMREAGCLVNQRSNTYCFVDAVAADTPSDFYFYALPLGTPLPNKTVPSCSSCVQSLLSLYAVDATNSSNALSKTYPGAADIAVKYCGSSYAQIVTVTGKAHRTAGALHWVVGVLGGAILMALGTFVLV